MKWLNTAYPEIKTPGSHPGFLFLVEGNSVSGVLCSFAGERLSFYHLSGLVVAGKLFRPTPQDRAGSPSPRKCEDP